MSVHLCGDRGQGLLPADLGVRRMEPLSSTAAERAFCTIHGAGAEHMRTLCRPMRACRGGIRAKLWRSCGKAELCLLEGFLLFNKLF